ncbi:MAG: 50S ribosomal protein L13 [Anaerolineae bacterium]|nr:50S ribosomal protein L13 [Anaerolineae bacterium]MBN8620693.1 50S ribosomal protein L13 [Anaerolineae bacterium]
MALYKTYVTKPLELERDWWIVDAKGQNLGRLASRIAPILRGKHKPVWVPNQDVGDYVIVINCELIEVTGNKLDEKMYYKYSGYPGGLSEINLRDQLRKFPDRPIIAAVKGMLPDGALGRNMLKKLKVYAGSEHPHVGQKPKVLEL